MNGGYNFHGHHGPDHVAPMNPVGSDRPAWWPTAEQKAHADAGCAHPDRCSLTPSPASSVDELREEWLAKVEVAEGLTSEARACAVIIADRVVEGLPPRPERVEQYRLADDRAKRAWASAHDSQAAFDQARATAAQVPA